jgi:chemotaxis protein MotA
MDFSSLVGIISGFGLIISAILLGGDADSFINTQGIMIVLGGTLSATLLTFPFKDVKTAFKAAYFVFSRDKQYPQELIQTMLELTKVSRSQGLLVLSDVETDSVFLKRACNLIADAADEEMVNKTLRTEINSLKMRHYLIQDVFKKMAAYAPAFGMLGTLIGLIQMLSKLDDPNAIGPAMAVALLTTFYGSLLATVVFLPIAGKLNSRTMTEVLNLEIIFEGANCILTNNNQLSVYEKLSSFLPPNHRPEMKSKHHKEDKVESDNG